MTNEVEDKKLTFEQLAIDMEKIISDIEREVTKDMSDEELSQYEFVNEFLRYRKEGISYPKLTPPPIHNIYAVGHKPIRSKPEAYLYLD